jgi:hypothetical protein
MINSNPNLIELIQTNINSLIDKVNFLGKKAGEQNMLILPNMHPEESISYKAESEIFDGIMKIGSSLMTLFFKAAGNGDKGFRVKIQDKTLTRKTLCPIHLLTVFGKVEAERWLYYGENSTSFNFFDENLDLPNREMSYFLQQIVGRLGIRDTFENTASFLKDLFKINISTHTVHEVVNELFIDHAEYNKRINPEPVSSENMINVVCFDGKGVPIIKEKTDKTSTRLKKGEKKNKKKEAIVGIDYVSEPKLRTAEEVAISLVKPEANTDKKKAYQKESSHDIYYQASLTAGKSGIIGEIADRVEKRSKVSGKKFKNVCVIDGAKSLAIESEKHFPEAEIILDIIHVSERFWNASHVFHKESSKEAKDMVYDLTLSTLNGNVKNVIEDLKNRQALEKLSKSKNEQLKKVIKYLDNHKEYMNYHRYLANGYPIATGVVESACGHLVKDRMEKSGARWSISGAESVLRLRSIYANNDWNEYLKFHRIKEHERLYKLNFDENKVVNF